MKPKDAKGVVFNIQRYSIHDGPGIRTTVFLKGCPLRCFWCQNPESQNRRPEVFLDENKCTLCGRCAAVCPSGASALGERNSTIDRDKCIGCGRCAEVCPNEARQLIGKYITVAQAMKEVLKDRKYYENSGGGVTLSGGDPVAQPDFAFRLLKSCKEAGLHTALDTCGYAPQSTMEKLLRYTDLVLYDIKHMDAREHYKGTGRSNRLILMNVKRFAKLRPMRIRIPLITGVNDSAEHISEIAQYVKAELGLIDVDLLPYNDMAETKYKRLGRTYIRLDRIDDAHREALGGIIAKIME